MKKYVCIQTQMMGLAVVNAAFDALKELVLGAFPDMNRKEDRSIHGELNELCKEAQQAFAYLTGSIGGTTKELSQMTKAYLKSKQDPDAHENLVTVNVSAAERKFLLAMPCTWAHLAITAGRLGWSFNEAYPVACALLKKGLVTSAGSDWRKADFIVVQKDGVSEFVPEECLCSASTQARELAGQAWHTPANEAKDVDPLIQEAFARILDEVLPK